MAVVGTSTFTPSTTGTAVSTVMPAGIAAGQIAYYAVGTNSGTATLTTPSGWTLVEGPVRAGSALSGWLFAKVLTGSEGGTTTTATLSASGRRHGIIAVVSTSASSFDTKTMWNDTSADTTLSVPAYTPGVANAQVVAITLSRYGTTNGTVTYPAGYTEHAEAITGYAVPNFAVAVASENLTGGPSAQPAENGTYTQVASTIGWVLTFAPTSTATSYPADGTAAVTSASTGIAAAVLLAAGVAAAVSGSTGAADRVPQVYAASGSASAVSASTGATTSRLGATGSAPATSATTGAGTSLLPASGTAPATTTSSAAVTSRLPASGSSDAVSGSSGSATIIGGSQSYPASGTAVVVSSANGSAGVRYGAAGSANATSAATGTTAARYGTAGTTSSASTSLGSAAARLRATGSASVVTSATGSTTALYVVGASVPLVSGTAGDTFALLAASGSAEVVSGSTGSATGGEHVTPIEVTVGAPQPARFAAAPPLPHPLTVATPAITVRAGNPLPPRYRRTDAALRR